MNNEKSFFKLQKRKGTTIIIIAITGLLLILLPSRFSGSYENSDKNGGYGTRLESKLKSTLESITGNNTIEVMITFENEYTSQNENKDVFSATSKSDNISEELPCPEIRGVMIVCKGIHDSNDFQTIKEAAATALGTEQNKIYIIGGTEH